MHGIAKRTPRELPKMSFSDFHRVWKQEHVVPSGSAYTYMCVDVSYRYQVRFNEVSDIKCNIWSVVDLVDHRDLAGTYVIPTGSAVAQWG